MLPSPEGSVPHGAPAQLSILTGGLSVTKKVRYYAAHTDDYGVLTVDRAKPSYEASVQSLATSCPDYIYFMVEPPAPTEPTGLGAVVEDANQDQWVSIGNGLWTAPSRVMRADVPHNHVFVRPYVKINAVRVLREGWKA